MGAPRCAGKGGAQGGTRYKSSASYAKYLLLEIVLLHNATLHYEARPFQVVNVL